MLGHAGDARAGPHVRRLAWTQAAVQPVEGRLVVDRRVHVLAVGLRAQVWSGAGVQNLHAPAAEGMVAERRAIRVVDPDDLPRRRRRAQEERIVAQPVAEQVRRFDEAIRIEIDPFDDDPGGAAQRLHPSCLIVAVGKLLVALHVARQAEGAPPGTDAVLRSAAARTVVFQAVRPVAVADDLGDRISRLGRAAHQRPHREEAQRLDPDAVLVRLVRLAVDEEDLDARAVERRRELAALEGPAHVAAVADERVRNVLQLGHDDVLAGAERTVALEAEGRQDTDQLTGTGDIRRGDLDGHRRHARAAAALVEIHGRALGIEAGDLLRAEGPGRFLDGRAGFPVRLLDRRLVDRDLDGRLEHHLDHFGPEILCLLDRGRAGNVDGFANLHTTVRYSRAADSGAGIRLASRRGSVLGNLAAFDDHVPGRLDVDLAAALQGDVLALDGDGAVLLHQDAGGAGLDRDLVADVDRQLLADADGVVLADRGGARLGDRQRLVLADVDRLVLADVERAVLAHRRRLDLGDVQRLVLADRHRAVLADADALVLPDGLRPVLADRDGLVLGDALGPVAADGDRLVVVDGLRPIVLDVGDLVVVDRLRAIVADPVRLVVLDLDVLVLLGVDEQLLRALQVLEPDLVEVVGAAALGAPGLDAGLRHVRRQRVGRHLLGVVDASGDDRLVGIAFQEVDDDLLADARDGDGAPGLAGPRLRHPDPARAVLALGPLAFPIPVEEHLHPAVLVGVDLVACRPDDHPGLRPLDERLRRQPRRAELLLARHRDEVAPVLRAAAVWHRFVVAVFQVVGGGHHQVLAILVLAPVPLEREQRADAHRLGVGGRL